MLGPRRQGAAPNSRKDSFTRRQYSARVLNKRVPRGRRPLGWEIEGEEPSRSFDNKARGGEENLPVEGLTGNPQEGVPKKFSSNSRKVQPLRELPQRLFANRPESLRR